MSLKGHRVLFAVVEKEGIINRINQSGGFSSVVIGKTRKTVVGKFLNIFLIDFRLWILALRFKPDVIFSPAAPSTGHVAKLLNVKNVCWGDTETATVNLKFSLPFIDCLLLPDCFLNKVSGRKIVRFNSYKEMAYLHPRRFRPDPSVLKKLGLRAGTRIILLRFSALNAMHDIGLRSVSDSANGKLLEHIKRLEKHGRVFVSMTEKDPGKEFEKYRLDIHPAEYVHFLSYCTLYIGEGTTTASEAGVLGIPWINIQKSTRGYLIDQERKYGLGRRTDNLDDAFATALEWLKDKNMPARWRQKRRKLLADKIDLTSFLIWFLGNYPASHKRMNDDPDFQFRFK
jgi:uncharacterized protein